jgi:two-component system, sensor histidine kinase
MPDTKWLHSLYQQAPVAIAIYIGPSHLVKFANPRMCQIWDRSPEQVLHRPLFEALPEVAGQGFEPILARVLQTGEAFSGDELPATLQRSGRLAQCYFNILYQPLHDDAGTVIGVTQTATEVTQLVEARQRVEQLNRQLEDRVRERTRQLTEQQQRLSRILEQVPAAVATLSGPQHRFSFANHLYQELVGGRTVVGQTVAEALPEVVEQGFIALLDRVRDTGEPFIGQETPIQLHDPATGQRQRRYLNFVYLPLPDAADPSPDILVFAVEVTQQVLAKRTIEANARQLRLLTDALPVLIGYLDREERYQFTNEAYRTWFNRDPQSLLGRPVREIVGEAAYQGVKAYIDRALAGERLDFESRMAYREDFVKYIRTSYVPDVQDGELRGFYTLVTDITEQTLARQQMEQANQELLTANQQLKRTNVDLDTFVYTASHDLKSPVVSLDALLGRLAGRLSAKLDSREQQMLNLIQASSQRLQNTIRDLTQVAQVQRDVQEERTLVDLPELFEEVRAGLADPLEASGARLVVDFGVALMAYSRKNLRSILYNLLSNALKYRSPERVPEILIRTRAQEGRTLLTVSDNGLGLTEQQQQGMFAMFKRFHSHVEGSGVGLYTIKRIIENYGGQIRVESQLGKGTTFQVLF